MKLKKLKKIQKKIKKLKGFTLVELIVVITIIIILGTIAFISFTGYSQSSRDSKRIADVGSIQKSLELYITEKGTYPIPDDNVSITYSGAIAWIGGTLGDGVITNIENINKKPIDPLTENEYAYSITSSKTEYQIGAIRESGQLGYKLPINQTHAASKKEAKAMIRGNYNARFLRVQSGSLNWVLAIPSIIVADITETELQTILNNKKLVHNNYSNIPHSYNKAGYTMTGGFEYTNSNPLIYSGSMKTLADDNEEKIKFVTSLKAAYNGSVLHGDPEYTEIVNLDTEINQTKAVNLVNNYVNSKVGGLGVTGTQKISMSNIICGLGYKEENGACVENCDLGYVYQDGQCVIISPTCVTGYIYNTVTDNCEINPTCPSGYTFNTTRDKCEMTPTCSTGYIYNTGTKLCQKIETITATTGTPTTCRAMFTGRDKFGLLSGNGGSCTATPGTQCYYYGTSRYGILFKTNCTIERWARDANRRYIAVGIGSSGVYTSSYERREEVYNTTPVNYTCPSGYTLGGSTCSRTLTASPTCSNSGVFSSTVNMCQLDATCSTGGVLNSDKCQLEATCSIGFLNTSLDACVKN